MSFLTNYRKKREAEMEKPSLIEETLEKLKKITEERDNLIQKVKEYEKITNETEQLKKEKTQLKKELEAVKTQLEEKNANILDKIEQIKEKNEKIEKLTIKIEKFESQMNTVSEKMNELFDKFEESKRENEQLKQQLYNQKIESAKSQGGQVSGLVDTLQRKIKKLERDVREKDLMIEQLKVSK